ncbi:MAG: aldehyde dehydrogenase (NAD+) [Cryomorphaceae bacterium]|jgi:aldehyde dehydrogenase (NAD+)
MYDFINGSEYAPAPESTADVNIKERYRLFIGGRWVDAHGKKTFETINPFNQKVLSKVADASKADVDLAVKAARAGYEGEWSRISGAERGKYLFRISRILQERAREFAVLESMDGGKPIRESRDIDIPLVAAHFFYYAGWADKLDYAFPGAGIGGQKVKPVGVVGQVIPWNFPLMMAAWKIAPALACGNTVVLKPAETTPLTALLLAEVIAAAGVPAGVVNIVTGGGDTGRHLVSHPDINKVAFTGSTSVGKDILKSVAGTDKSYTLELGGKAAHIIMDDAAIDQAVEGIVNGIFFNQGHVCCAGSRLLVQEGVVDKVVKKLQKRMQTLIVGNPLDKNTDIGAINSKEQLAKIKALVKTATKEGATVWQPDTKIPRKGNFYPPTLILDCAQSHTVVQQEIFGPVLTIQSFRTVNEAIEKANNTQYGLSGGVWSDKGAKVFKLTDNINAGVMWANTYNAFDPVSPFGGFKESGIGREGGLHGLYPYVKFNA